MVELEEVSGMLWLKNWPSVDNYFQTILSNEVSAYKLDAKLFWEQLTASLADIISNPLVLIVFVVLISFWFRRRYHPKPWMKTS